MSYLRPKKFLVLGLGAWAFGRERRATRMLGNLPSIESHFIVSRFQDGSVPTLLTKHGLTYSELPFGYLGRANLSGSLVTLALMPSLHLRLLWLYFRNKFSGIVMLGDDHPFINALLAIPFLKYVLRSEIISYLGDVPMHTRKYRVLSWLVNQLTSRYIVNSGAVKSALVENGVPPTKIEIIYNGIDLKKHEAGSLIPLRERLGWSSDGVIVGFVGQLNSDKGVEDLVDALGILRERAVDCRLVFIGRETTGDSHRLLMKRIGTLGLSPIVGFTGWIEHMEDVYASLDFIAAPSRMEDAAPNVVIEAMASGIAVVATRVGGLPELVVDGTTGRLVDPGQPQRLADAIAELAADHELRRRMGEAGRARAHDLFDLNKNRTQLEELLLNG